MPAALILIADGTEEMEFTITYDTLVRAGVDTTSAFVPNLLSATGAESGFDPLAAKGSRGIYIVPDICLSCLYVDQINTIFWLSQVVHKVQRQCRNILLYRNS